ncbi:MAG: hypothetical protein R3C16_06345 [Hyphomonadaceae bacterium]
MARLTPCASRARLFEIRGPRGGNDWRRPASQLRRPPNCRCGRFPPPARAENFSAPPLTIRAYCPLRRLDLPPDIADPDLEAVRAALLALSDCSLKTVGAIDREALTLHLTRSGHERAAARVSRWPKPAKPAEDADLEAEWLALATREVVAPAIREELAELRVLAAEGDNDAFARFQALSREARDIEARAREAKLDEVQNEADDGLVA